MEKNRQKPETLEIIQGKTFRMPIRWQTLPMLSKTIQNITMAGIAVVSVAGHGAPEGWPVVITGVKGMTEINAPDPNLLQRRDFRTITVIDHDTVEINGIDSSGFHAYSEGGFLKYYTPVDLSGFTARMSIKDRIGGTELFSLTSANGRIVIDNALKTITLDISADDSAAIEWKRGVFELELVSGDVPAVVTRLMFGTVEVVKEVTKP